MVIEQSIEINKDYVYFSDQLIDKVFAVEDLKYQAVSLKSLAVALITKEIIIISNQFKDKKVTLAEMKLSLPKNCQSYKNSQKYNNLKSNQLKIG